MSDLSNVKVGDTLACSVGYGLVSIIKVDRITKTQVICGVRRFNRDGRLIGSHGFNTPRAWPATEKDILNARIKRAQGGLDRLKVSAENIDSVEALLKTTKMETI
jgi:hypothetical protein